MGQSFASIPLCLVVTFILFVWISYTYHHLMVERNRKRMMNCCQVLQTTVLHHHRRRRHSQQIPLLRAEPAARWLFAWGETYQIGEARRRASVVAFSQALNETLGASCTACWRAPRRWLPDKWIPPTVFMATQKAAAEDGQPRPSCCARPSHLKEPAVASFHQTDSEAGSVIAWVGREEAQPWCGVYDLVTQLMVASLVKKPNAVIWPYKSIQLSQFIPRWWKQAICIC